jgi:peptidoglycan hydrolase-like protein with peptidoglycan-binding domain
MRALALVWIGAIAAGALSCAHAREVAPVTEPLPALWQDGAGVVVSSSATGLLRDGAERLIQQRLVALGLLRPDQVSGRLDDATVAALRVFQARAGLAQTGLPSYATVSRLGLPLDRVFRANPEGEALLGRAPDGAGADGV